MPNWKKLITSGSSGSLAYLSVDTSIDAQSFTGSLLSTNGVLSSSAQIANDISGSITSTSSSIASDIATLVAFSSSLETTIYDYTGSFTGDGSGLTGVESTVTEQVTLVDTFTSATTHSIAHTFATKNLNVTVYDENDDVFIPSRINTPTTSSVVIYMDPATSGRAVISKGGHLVSGSIATEIVTSSTVSDTFTSATTHSVAHTFGTKDVFVTVYDTNDDVFIPSRISTPTTSSVVVYMDPATSGRVVIGKAGHIVSGSSEAAVDWLTVSSSIIPHTTEVFDLGSSSKRWKDLYLSGSTIDLGGTKITRDATTGDIEFKDSGNNRKSLKVDELTIGTGASARKIKVNNGRVQFTDTSDNVESSSLGTTIPSANNTYDLGSPTAQWRHLYLSTASLYMDGTKVLSSNADVLTFTTDVGQSIKLLETGADDIILQTDTGNIELKGTVEILSGKKITDSAGTKILFGDSIGITGSIDLSGTVDGIDLQAFSSSVATSIANSTADYTQLTNVPSGIISGAAQLPSGTVSGSSQITITESQISDLTHYTDSDVKTKLNSENVVSGSAQVVSLLNSQDLTLNNLTVSGTTTTVDSTTVEIGDNIIALNGIGATKGGLAINDGPASGSLLWDGTNNYWIAGPTGSESEIITVSNLNSKLPSGTVSGSSQITITESQISDLSHYSNSDVLTYINSLAVVSGSLSYYTDSDTLSYINTLGVVSGSGQVVSLINGQNVTLGTVSATTITETSALRFKENIETIDDGSLVDKLRPVSYDWKDSKEKDYGFIAEEVADLNELLVTKNPDGEISGIKYTKLIPFLVKKIQEQEKRIKQLENGNS